jgi:hypothetical protein
MAEYAPCKICNTQAEHIPDQWFPVWHCPRCGKFDYDRSLGWRKITSPEEMVKLSGWVHEQNAAGDVPVRITRERAARAMQKRLPGLRERASHVLLVIARDYGRNLDAGFVPTILNSELLGVSYSRDQEELIVLFNILLDDGYVRPHPSGSPECTLSIRGLLAAEALAASGSSSAQGFVAMSFDESLRDAWTDGFHPGIQAAGFRPLRLYNDDYVGGITDEIMAQIKRSRFVVADYTSQRNSVYFEAGFALGLGVIVIPTCRADEIPNLHFDIKHLNTLPWTTPAELADGLNRRIRAVVGVGPDDPDPS